MVPTLVARDVPRGRALHLIDLENLLHGSRRLVSCASTLVLLDDPTSTN